MLRPVLEDLKTNWLQKKDDLFREILLHASIRKGNFLLAEEVLCYGVEPILWKVCLLRAAQFRRAKVFR